MIRPSPYIVFCKQCQYSKIIHPKSDALSLGDFMQFCPKCNVLMKRKEELALLDKIKLFVFKS